MPYLTGKGFIVIMTIKKDILQSIVLSKTAGPIYRQLANGFGQLIKQGVLKPGEKLPTHRNLADVFGVTVGTVTRAYAEAEKQGLVEARVGAGTFVRQADKPGWFLEPVVLQSDQCNLGYNIPPPIDRSQMLQNAMQALSNHPSQLNSIMLYQKAEGFDQHRQCIADWLKKQGVAVDPARMLFTSGAQHGAQLAITALCRAGDAVLVEKYTYPGFISLARQQQITLKPVDMDEEGLLPESLEVACKQYKPRAIYCTPTLQNPTTATMSPARRQQILEICRRHQVMVLEDDVNGLLPANHPEPLVNIDPENVIYIGSLSKCLAPGLRVGYIHAPQHLYRKLAITLQNQCWMVSPLLTGLACELIISGGADRALQSTRTDIRLRQNKLEEVLPAFAMRMQPDCFHVWLEVPPEWELKDFVRTCRERDVTVKSGELFVTPGYLAPKFVRLAISAPESLRQLEGGLQSIRCLLQGSSEE